MKLVRNQAGRTTLVRYRRLQRSAFGGRRDGSGDGPNFAFVLRVTADMLKGGVRHCCYSACGSFVDSSGQPPYYAPILWVGQALTQKSMEPNARFVV